MASTRHSIRFGYSGRTLRVNLSNRKLSIETLSEERLRKFFGGRGLGARMLMDEVGPGIHPLSPENCLMFLTGPMTSAPYPGSNFYSVVSKSPLTGIYGEGVAGRSFGLDLKKTGFDVIIIEGQSDSPVFLWVHDGEASIEPADGIWGLTPAQTDERIRQILGDKTIKVSSIGVAGEKLAPIASIMNDIHSAVGRCGLGAVMGSKRLKAVAVRGTTKIPIADRQRVSELRKKYWVKLKENGWIQTLREYGTTASVWPLHMTGELPTQNFQKATFEGAADISLDQLIGKFKISTKNSCPGCPIACKKHIILEGVPLKSPEYETTSAFGPLLLNRDYKSIVQANEICNSVGIDTISAGVIVAFTIECVEKGVLSPSDMDGIALRWGEPSGIIQLLRKIARREGIGELLSQGVRYAAKSLGKGTEEFAIHVKGLEMAQHTPRPKKALALSYATSVRGACHMQSAQDPLFEKDNSMPDLGITEAVSRYEIKGKAKITKMTQDQVGVRESLILCSRTCQLGVINLDELADLVSAVTGWDLDARELLEIGERANNLCRAFSVLEYVSRVDDMLPLRFAQPLPNGPSQGQKIDTNDLNRMLDEYYALRGWTTDGVPKRDLLKRLGLDDVADTLESSGRLEKQP